MQLCVCKGQRIFDDCGTYDFTLLCKLCVWFVDGNKDVGAYSYFFIFIIFLEIKIMLVIMLIDYWKW